MTPGRPTDYKPEFGEKILEEMAKGLSLTAAAAKLDIYRQRVYDWEKSHPEFSEAVQLARSKRQLFLESRLLEANNSSTVTSTIFALKNAAPDDWREKQHVESKIEVKDVSGHKDELTRKLSKATAPETSE